MNHEDASCQRTANQPKYTNLGKPAILTTPRYTKLHYCLGNQLGGPVSKDFQTFSASSFEQTELLHAQTRYGKPARWPLSHRSLRRQHKGKVAFQSSRFHGWLVANRLKQCGGRWPHNQAKCIFESSVETENYLQLLNVFCIDVNIYELWVVTSLY